MSHLQLVLWSGLLIGLIFGAAGQASRFCLQRGLVQRWSRSGGGQLQAFALALCIAILGTQALAAGGWVELDDSLYLMPAYSWLLIPLGGLMFGYGMALANGCGARALVLLGQGNLRSLVVLLCLAVAAYMTLTGVLAPWRVALSELTTVRPAHLSPVIGWTRLALVGVVSLVLLTYALRQGAWRRHLPALIGGAIVGQLVVAGWLVTGWLGADDFDPVPVVSLTFVAPIGDTLQYAMIATGMELRFGIVVVTGVVIGAFLAAALRKELRLQGFDTPHDMMRYIGGGLLMGSGGALALGCSIGQGLTGLSTLSYSSMLAAVTIVAGARLRWSQVRQKELRAAAAVS